MILFCNADGTIVKNLGTPVYQGAANSNTLYLIAPYAPNLTATVGFMLPDGTAVAPDVMTPQNAVAGGQNADGTTYAGWSYTLPAQVTAKYGTVTAQFYFYAPTGENTANAIVATSSTSFQIGRGVVPVLPDTPDADVYANILTTLSQLQTDINNGYYAARAIYAWNSAYTYGANEITFYPSIGNYGAFVKSIVENNTDNAPYVNGEINSQYWSEVVNFNTIAADFFADVQAAVTQAENAASIAEAQAQAAENAASDIGQYASSQVQFVDSLPETGNPQYVYAMLNNASQNLFDLYVYENGAWVYKGSANLVVNATDYYFLQLTAAGWSNNTQTLTVEGLTTAATVVATPAEGSGAQYVLCGVQASAIVENGVQFTCKTVPEVVLNVVLAITWAQDIPTADGYYTETEVNNLLSQKQNVTDNTLQTTSKTVVGAINENYAAIQAEVSAREEADSALSDRIDAIVSSESKSLFAAVSVPSTAWSGNSVTLTQTDAASIAFVTASSILLVSPADGSAANVQTFGITATAQGVGTITLSATATPTATVNLNIVILN